MDQHFYDFEREPELLKTLGEFFTRIRRSKAAKKWVESIDKMIQRRVSICLLKGLGPHQHKTLKGSSGRSPKPYKSAEFRKEKTTNQKQNPLF